MTQLIAVLLFAALISLGVNQYGIALSLVSGSSMRPTLHNGDFLLVNKFSALVKTPQRGEIITFQDPMNERRYLVKRVIGIAGDRVEVKKGLLYLNRHKLQEKYIDTHIEDGNFGPVTVAQGTVFVLGDNRHRFASRDSRYENVGFVPVHLIDGKVELILWRPSLEANL